MHPAIWAIPICAAGAVAIYCAFCAVKEQMQEREYWNDIRHAERRAGGEEQVFEQRIMRELLSEIEPKLQELRRHPAGRERTRKIRAFRAAYHPDRYASTPFMQRAVEQISGIINDRTGILLREDEEAR